MNTAGSLAKDVGVKDACNALVIPRASFYRWRYRGEHPMKDNCRPAPPLALTYHERKDVLSTLREERFVDQAPQEVYAALLDGGSYLCSVRTMYRILEENQEVRERRNQLRHPSYTKPEILATAPNQVWSWDITKLRGPVKWTYYYLYVILDIFSRYVVGWMVAHREKSALAKKLIEQSCEKQGIQRDQLIIVSNDNPYSESQFKTMKYRPDFPERFGCIEDSRSFCLDFFHWYNTMHYHSGIGYLTPEDVHYGRAEQIIKEREKILKMAFEKHPEHQWHYQMLSGLTNRHRMKVIR
ncbi:MAG: DDE-type integrase/transposase/recombinase [Deltaproteobacteria bacterium]|nr:DDE-type integrase/transposase/recombinase [Deltaproteobacteria bacterium]